jgi:DNA-binding MarR family transcriptional regulator
VQRETPEERATASDEESLLDGIVQVSFAVMAVLTRVGSAHDLSLTQLRLLAILRDREPTMSELAAHLGLDRSSVSGLVDRSTKRGLVHRIASDVDRRSSRVGLTAAGHSFAGRLTAEVALRTEELTNGLTGREREVLARLLLRIIESQRSRPTPDR